MSWASLVARFKRWWEEQYQTNEQQGAAWAKLELLKGVSADIIWTQVDGNFAYQELGAVSCQPQRDFDAGARKFLIARGYAPPSKPFNNLPRYL